MNKQREKTPEQALSRLMALCARAEKSSGDALRLMRGWGIDPAKQKEILDRLIRERFIDDARYCAAYVREKVKFGGWGTYKIRAALAAKGISRAVIEEALAKIDPGQSAEKLEKLLRARVARLTGTPYEIKGKLARYGASLGYEYDVVADVVERILK